MLDFAEVVVINKFERRGADDALRDVRRQFARNRGLFHVDLADLPVFGTTAARFNDDGVTALYQHLRDALVERGLPAHDGVLAPIAGKTSSRLTAIVPPARQRYLADIVDTVHGYHRRTQQQAELAQQRQHLQTAAALLRAGGRDAADADELAAGVAATLDNDVAALLEAWPARRDALVGPDRQVRESLSGTLVPKLKKLSLYHCGKSS